MEELNRITSLLRKTYDTGAWHGPTVKEVLRDITPAIALKGLPNTHTIIELVAHMTSWRIFTIKRLQDDALFTVTDEMNFPSTTDWPTVLQNLENSQQQLIAAITAFPPARLSELVPHAEYRYTFYTLLHGIIHHDLYHIGQIVLIKKSYQ